MTLDTLRKAMREPYAFYRGLTSGMSPLGRRLMLARLKPKIEPLLARHELTWEDVLPVVALVASVATRQAAVATAAAFGGPSACKMARAWGRWLPA